MSKYRVGGRLPILALGAFLSFSLSASAADIVGGPGLKDGVGWFPVLWAGPYVGGHAGGAWGNTGTTDSHNYTGDPTDHISVNGSGVIAGGQIGYNIQRGNIVFGPEADLGYLGLSGNKTAHLTQSPSCYGGSAQCWLDGKYSVSGGLYGDITGRLGYAAGNTLVYAKGGFAFLDEGFKANYKGGNCTYNSGGCGSPVAHNVPSTFNYNHDFTQWGWTVGAGVEYALNPSWSIKAEYQHFDFGTTSYSYSGTYYIPNAWGWHSTLTGKTDVSLTADTVKFGVNYHVGSVVAPWKD